MGDQLFAPDSIWTMLHGIALGGGGLVTLFTAFFSLQLLEGSPSIEEDRPQYLFWLLMLIPGFLWLSVLAGTYIVFPRYRTTPPEGITDLIQFPKSFIQSNPNTIWLHSFAMETKEHLPWIPAMLSSAVAFVAVRYRLQLLTDRNLNRVARALLLLSFLIVSYIALLGTFVNKAAPLQ
ncbi:MAG TPA: hypothetical protein VKZ59_11695 [Acidobacteriota bacterium]|nr:hypothetical protein [Acidobacteriota bacterium]